MPIFHGATIGKGVSIEAPTTLGSNGDVLTSDGAGNSMWQAPIVTLPGGSDGQLQYKSGGSFAGAAQLNYDSVNDRLGIGEVAPAARQHTTAAETGIPVATFKLAAGHTARAIKVSDSIDTEKAYVDNDGTFGGRKFETPGTGFNIGSSGLWKWELYSNYGLDMFRSGNEGVQFNTPAIGLYGFHVGGGNYSARVLNGNTPNMNVGWSGSGGGIRADMALVPPYGGPYNDANANRGGDVSVFLQTGGAPPGPGDIDAGRAGRLIVQMAQGNQSPSGSGAVGEDSFMQVIGAGGNVGFHVGYNNCVGLAGVTDPTFPLEFTTPNTPGGTPHEMIRFRYDPSGTDGPRLGVSSQHFLISTPTASDVLAVWHTGQSPNRVEIGKTSADTTGAPKLIVHGPGIDGSTKAFQIHNGYNWVGMQVWDDGDTFFAKNVTIGDLSDQSGLLTVAGIQTNEPVAYAKMPAGHADNGIVLVDSVDSQMFRVGADGSIAIQGISAARYSSGWMQYGVNNDLQMAAGETKWSVAGANLKLQTSGASLSIGNSSIQSSGWGDGSSLVVYSAPGSTASASPQNGGEITIQPGAGNNIAGNRGGHLYLVGGPAGSGGTDGNVLLATNGSNQIGNVGIGSLSSDPSHLLHVETSGSGSQTSSAILNKAYDTTGGRQSSISCSTVAAASAGASLTISGWGRTDPQQVASVYLVSDYRNRQFELGVYGTQTSNHSFNILDTSANERFTILDYGTGNVGVKETAPAADFQVTGADSSQPTNQIKMPVSHTSRGWRLVDSTTTEKAYAKNDGSIWSAVDITAANNLVANSELRTDTIKNRTSQELTITGDLGQDTKLVIRNANTISNYFMLGGDGCYLQSGNTNSATNSWLCYHNSGSHPTSDVTVNTDRAIVWSGTTQYMGGVYRSSGGSGTFAGANGRSGTDSDGWSLNIVGGAGDGTGADGNVRLCYTGSAARGGLSFFDTAPVTQQSSTGETAGFTAGAGVTVKDDSTFTGNIGSTAYRVSDVVKALKNYGLLAS